MGMEKSTTDDVDLTNCDREPIHLSGRIQPFGFFLAFSPDWIVNHVSENFGEYAAGEFRSVLGKSVIEIFSENAIHAIRNRMQNIFNPGDTERIFGLMLFATPSRYDVSVHIAGELTIIEAEPSADAAANWAEQVQTLARRLHSVNDLESFYRAGVRAVSALLGFDRVKLYRFEEDGAGEVIAESVQAGIESFLGLHFPPSDIPRQARELYLRNWLRIIPNVDYVPCPISPAHTSNGKNLDLSHSVLRSVSPIHVEYLKNMGVSASLSISVVCEGKLWGLFACHHYAPRNVDFARRSAAELFGQMFSWLLETRLREAAYEYENTGREIHAKVMGRLAKYQGNLDGLKDALEDISEVISSDGVALSVDGRIYTRGETPTADDVSLLCQHLSSIAAGEIVCSNQISKQFEPATTFVDRAAGMIAIPVSRRPCDYLVFFRREVGQMVTWAGNPEKSITLGPNGDRLTPRSSFNAWKQVVHGKCRPWNDADRRIAESLRATLLEVVLRLTDAAAEERKAAHERQELLIAELNHRVRNILNLIRALIVQSRGEQTSIDEYAGLIDGRVQALARAHDQITSIGWGPGSLLDLIKTEATAFLNTKADRLRVEGSDVQLLPQALTTLALVVHELITNSAKYGALSDSSGSVQLSIERGQKSGLTINWKERGGPIVRPPCRRGFGTTIIERSVPYELKGEAEINYKLSGVEARFFIPQNWVSETAKGARDESARASPQKVTVRAGKTAFILEDNLIIAMAAEQYLNDLGFARVDLASSCEEAIRRITQNPPSFAVLDYNLGAETSLPVAQLLSQLGIPFIFATGYGEHIDLPEEHRNRAIVKKPYNLQSIRDALAGTDI
jgi:light-regulated signal transduction histidine kinase (bacteriophytochrome)